MPRHSEITDTQHSLVGSGHLDKAAIISAAGDSVWASTSGFTLKPEEMKHIADILDNANGAVDKGYSEGVHVGGVRYVLTKVEGRSLYARQVRLIVLLISYLYGDTRLGASDPRLEPMAMKRRTDTRPQQGRNGLCVAKTKQAILVGHHGEAQQAGNATQTVEALADYLIGVGY